MAMLSFFPVLVAAVFIAIVSSGNENEVVSIVNSGSTNTAGYVIELQRNGIAKWTVGRRFLPGLSSTSSSSTAQMSMRLSSILTNRVFRALQRSMPLTQFPEIDCIKSASFGPTTHVIFNGQQSPDISCPQTDNRLIALSKAVFDVISALHINTWSDEKTNNN